MRRPAPAAPAGPRLDGSQLSAWLAERLPAHMIPAFFVTLGRLPLTANGKVDRAHLPDPRAAAARRRAGPAAPRTDDERAIAAIWAELLDAGEVGMEDNFFELGGHSLIATRMAARIAAQLGVRVGLREIFEARTVAGLAALVAQRRGEPAAEAAPVLVADPARRHESFPLTDVQHAYWMGRLGHYELGDVATHVYLEFCSADFDPDRARATLTQLTARHDMLRAVVAPDGTQRVLAEVPPADITVEDLSAAPPAEADRRVAAVRDELSHEVRPAGQWPLFELRAQRLPGGSTRIHLSMDMLIADGTSIITFLNEWAAIYPDPEQPRPPLGITFRDYLAAAATRGQGPGYERARDYWLARLDDLPATPELPLAGPGDRDRGPTRFTHRTFRLEPAAWDRLKARARQGSVTPTAILLTAYADVLARWSRTPRFTVTVTVGERLPLHPDVDRIIGDFTALSLLAVDAAPDGDFAARARRVAGQLWQDLEHGQFGAVRVLRELARARGTSRVPMPVVFTSLLDAELGATDGVLPGLGRPVGGSSQTSQVYLDHQVYEMSGALHVNWDSVDGLFEPGVVAEMFGAFCAVVRGLADESGAGWGPAAVALPGWQSDLVAEVNATAGPVPEGLLFSPLLEAARQRPEAVAVAGAGRELSYAELCRRASWVAVQLAGQGVSPGQLVGVSASKGPEQVVAALGVLLAGAAYVPVDPELPPARRAYVLDHGQVAVVVTGPGAGPDWPAQVAVDLDDPAQVAAGPPPCAATPGDLAYVLYTSGSTGEPKGVAVCHRAALNTCADICDRFGLGPADRVLGLSSLSFDLSVWDIFGVLGAGGALILPEPGARRDPARWRQLATDHQVTVWNSVPALMEMFTETCAATPGGPPPGLRLVLMSGDWIPVGLPGRIRALWPHCEVISLGGATEAAIWSIWHRAGDPEPGWDSVPYGKPLRNQTWQVLNDRLEPCPVWVTGELFIGGTGLAEGYWRDEERTAAAFFPHPATGERLYRTGDLGRRHPDGTIEFLGRQDSQVKIGGYRIELGEIETVLAAAPGVAAAIAGTAGDRHHRRLVAAIIPAPGQPRNPAADTTRADAARQHARQHLPAYMIPAAITTIDQLPLTANGKVNRNALTTTPPPPHQPSHPPATTTPTQQAVLAEVRQLLGTDSVSMSANLFDIGIDSVLIVRVHQRLQHRLGREFELTALFEHGTIASLASWLDGSPGPADPAELVTRSQDRASRIRQARRAQKEKS